MVVGIFTIGFPLFCAAIQGVAPTTCGGVDPHQLVRKVMRLMPSWVIEFYVTVAEGRMEISGLCYARIGKYFLSRYLLT